MTAGGIMVSLPGCVALETMLMAPGNPRLFTCRMGTAPATSQAILRVRLDSA